MARYSAGARSAGLNCSSLLPVAPVVVISVSSQMLDSRKADSSLSPRERESLTYEGVDIVLS